MIRDSFNQMNLGDVSVKKFGNETDFIVKFEKQNSNDPEFIKNIQNKLSSSIGDVDFRRVENVGPKVSSELKIWNYCNKLIFSCDVTCIFGLDLNGNLAWEQY